MSSSEILKVTAGSTIRILMCSCERSRIQVEDTVCVYWEYARTESTCVHTSVRVYTYFGMAHQFYCVYVTVKYYCSCAGSPSPLEPTTAAKKRKKYDSETTMSNKRKATSSKIQSTSVTLACKNNWIFTATLDSDAVEKLCLTIFDINRNLNTEVFEYAIVGTNPSSNRKKGGDSYDIFGYVQIKKHRWNRRELLRHFGVTVTTYSSTECVFGNLEGKWKPNSVVEHIKMVCPTHITEGGKLRKRGSKPNTKKED